MRLPVLNCDGCIGCCLEQSSPPGYAALLPERPDRADAARADPQQARWFAAAPEEAVALIRAHTRSPRRGEPGPCVWLDLQNRRCRWYECRPRSCREDVNPGDRACRYWRERYPPEPS